jgi:acetylornithine/succinyldiaminopimelate/putrescine aminotransferase
MSGLGFSGEEETMETQSTINLVLGAGMSALGWFAREMWAAVKELKTDLAHLREELPKDYVLKDDLEKALARIDTKLDKIFDRLDAKADKRSTD